MDKDDVEVEKALKSRISKKSTRFNKSKITKAFSRGVVSKKTTQPTSTQKTAGQQAKTWFGFPLDPIDEELDFLGDNEPKDEYPISDSCRTIINGQEGCTCRKCNLFYPYAEPNMEREQFECYSCRLDADISSGKK